MEQFNDIKLSVVYITYNEEKNIGRSLAAIIEIADEILVIDSYSNDQTVVICQQFGARVIQHKFEGHIQQKNFAASQAKYDHVLSLDADEVPNEILLESIKKVKQDWIADGFTMNRLTNYCGTWIHHCGWHPDKKLRLWDRRLGNWGGINPHDKYEMVEGARISHLKGDLLHYSYYTREDHYKQIEKFTDILALSMFERGRKVSTFYIGLATIFKFFRDYILKLGLLDGKAGFIISWLSAGATRKKFIKLRRLYVHNKTEKF